MNEINFNELFLSEATKQALTELIQFRINIEKKGITDIPYNITLEVDDTTNVREIAKALGDALENVKCRRNITRLVYENNSLNAYDDILRADSSVGIIIIDGCSDILFDNIADIEYTFNKTPLITKILCLTKEQLERLRTEYEGFYYRTIGHQDVNHISELSMSPENISAYINNILESKYHYEITKLFDKELKRYITTVLPRADLKGKEFADDLKNRILRQILVTNDEKIITVDCIPYYKERGELNEEPEPSTDIIPDAIISVPTVEERKPIPVPKKEIEQSEIPACTAENVRRDKRPEYLNFTKSENEHENVLLLSLSTFGRDMKENTYKFNDDEYNGIYQLDPVPKALAKKLANKGEYIDKIIMLATGDTSDPQEKEIIYLDEQKERYKGTAIDYFKSQVRNYMRPATSDEELFVTIRIDESDPAKGIIETVEKLRSIGKISLYIDIHGGFRDITIVLESIISLMKTEGIPAKEVYTVLFSGADRNRIKIDESHKMFDFVSGINEFLSFGRVDSLENYFKGKENTSDKDLIKAIETISSAISLCNMVNFEKGLKKLKAYYQTNTESSDAYLRIFADTIKKDYGNLFECDGDPTPVDEIEWCVKKRFYQPALTLLESKMPTYLFGDKNQDGASGIFTIPDRQKLVMDYEKDPKYKYKTDLDFVNEYFYKDKLSPQFTDLSKLKNETNFCQMQLVDGDYHKKIKSFNQYDYLKLKRNVENGENLTANLLAIHAALKKERNSANHSLDKKRATPEQIENALRLYIDIVRYLETCKTHVDLSLDKNRIFIFEVTEIIDKAIQGKIEGYSDIGARLAKTCFNENIKLGDKIKVWCSDRDNNHPGESYIFKTVGDIADVQSL